MSAQATGQGTSREPGANRVIVDLPGHGRFVAQNVAQYEHAIRTVSAIKMAREVALAYEGESGLPRVSTAAYWRGYTKAVLAIVWLDAYHSACRAGECKVCG